MILLIVLIVDMVMGTGPRCEKAPPGQMAAQTRGDQGFFVTVAGGPKLYRPGQEYTVTLEGSRIEDPDPEPKNVKFMDFMIVAESNLPSTEVTGLGDFQLLPGDAMSKFSHRCSHAVMATSALSKEQVSVLWTAPPLGSGCIHLRAMVVERNDFWYMDDNALTYTICEDDSPMAAPPVVEPCSACDEAKYEVIFEGLWSRHTHPKDFPRDEWQTQFSHMIGASHSIDYDLWKYGEIASPALTMLSESGETKKLEIDMKRYSKNIRSVIKARGLQQRSNVIGRTFAVFRMDATKHLLSLVSKIIPSPDWIVGVSMENLCLPNGSWVDSRVRDLYPWDAGTNSGLGYHDVGDETMPREPIHRITSCNPDNDASPFFDPTCAPVRPLARLHILKQREYKKQCPGRDENGILPLNPSWELGTHSGPGMNGGDGFNGNSGGQRRRGEEQDLQYDDYDDQNAYRDDQSSRQRARSRPRTSGRTSTSARHCQVSEWSEWTSCSQTCGRGSQSQSRSYPNPTGAKIKNCAMKMINKRVCPSNPDCPAKSYDPFFGGDEFTSGYSSQWSDRGLSSQSLRKVAEEDVQLKSYHYQGQPSRQVGTPSSYSHSSIHTRTEPQVDTYGPLSGYAKQKGYPPRTNHPSSNTYNPYMEMGYYGYTYGGPPTGSYWQNNYETTVNDQGDPSTGETVPEIVQSSCETGDWGSWSHCSTDCGTGIRTRTRRYTGQETSSCTADLLATEQCEERSGCSRQVQEESSTASPRSRISRVQTTEQTTPITRRPRPMRRPTRPQNLPGPQRQVGRRRKFSNGDPQCAVAEWTDWSPCSVTCNQGYKIRTRVYTMPFVLDRTCDNIRLTQKQDCRLAVCWNSEFYDAHDDSGFRPDSNPDPPITLTTVETPLQSFCILEPTPGICKTSNQQWFYNATERSCARFLYTGCGGNMNNFDSEEECLTACQPQQPQNRFRGLQSQSLIREGFLQDQAQVAQDCEVTNWNSWSTCSTSCGRGWHTRERSIITEANQGGRRCPVKLMKRKRCIEEIPCPASPPSWYQSNWRMLEDRRTDN